MRSVNWAEGIRKDCQKVPSLEVSCFQQTVWELRADFGQCLVCCCFHISDCHICVKCFAYFFLLLLFLTHITILFLQVGTPHRYWFIPILLPLLRLELRVSNAVSHTSNLEMTLQSSIWQIFWILLSPWPSS